MTLRNKLTQTIGIIGGGQLGKMLAEAGQPWNTRFVILESDPSAPASSIAQHQIIGGLYNRDKIYELAEKADVLTYEIEHLNVQALLELEASGKQIFPKPSVLALIQDKGLQKQFFTDHQIPTAPFVLADREDNWHQKALSLSSDKVAVKLRTQGYDGKGVCLTSISSLELSKPFDANVLIEVMAEGAAELAVMVAVDQQGYAISYPAVEMEFDSKANLVEFLCCPARLKTDLVKKAELIAKQLVLKLQSPGLFAVEFLVTSNEEVWVNEIAPRPHNSGHHSIEACYTSQYEQLNRILLNLPLGSTTLIQPAVMMNILGSESFSGEYRLEGIEEALNLEGVYLHFYGKTENRPKRKMGHLTAMANNLDEAILKARKARDIIKFLPL